MLGSFGPIEPATAALAQLDSPVPRCSPAGIVNIIGWCVAFAFTPFLFSRPLKSSKTQLHHDIRIRISLTPGLRKLGSPLALCRCCGGGAKPTTPDKCRRKPFWAGKRGAVDDFIDDCFQYFGVTPLGFPNVGVQCLSVEPLTGVVIITNNHSYLSRDINIQHTDGRSAVCQWRVARPLRKNNL